MHTGDYLKHSGDGSIYVWTEALAALSHMIEPTAAELRVWFGEPLLEPAAAPPQRKPRERKKPAAPDGAALGDSEAGLMVEGTPAMKPVAPEPVAVGFAGDAAAMPVPEPDPGIVDLNALDDGGDDDPVVD